MNRDRGAVTRRGLARDAWLLALGAGPSAGLGTAGEDAGTAQTWLLRSRACLRLSQSEGSDEGAQRRSCARSRNAETSGTRSWHQELAEHGTLSKRKRRARVDGTRGSPGRRLLRLMRKTQLLQLGTRNAGQSSCTSPEKTLLCTRSAQTEARPPLRGQSGLQSSVGDWEGTGTLPLA